MRKPLEIKGRVFGQGTPIVCVPVMAKTKDTIVAEVKRLVADHAEMIEWRVDQFEQYDSPNAIREVFAELKPLVTDTILLSTYRSKPEGGQGRYDKELIHDINEVAAECKVADIIDFEYFAYDKSIRELKRLQNMGACIVVSHHNFNQTPDLDVIEMILEEEYASGADIVKLALMPNSKADLLHVLTATLHFHETHPDVPVITMSMGSTGMLSRIAGEDFGSCVTFGAGSQASAPGQLPQKELHLILDTLHKCR